jgi:hypothetical protein
MQGKQGMVATKRMFEMLYIEDIEDVGDIMDIGKRT